MVTSGAKAHEIAITGGTLIEWAYAWRCDCGRTSRGDMTSMGLAVRLAVDHVPPGHYFRVTGWKDV